MIKITYTIKKDISFNPLLWNDRKEKFAHWFTTVHVRPDGNHPTSIESYQSGLKTIGELLGKNEEEFYSIVSTTILRIMRSDMLNFETFKKLGKKRKEDLPAIFNTYILFNKWLMQYSVAA